MPIRTPTEVIAKAVDIEGSAAIVADLYEIPLTRVREAVGRNGYATGSLKVALNEHIPRANEHIPPAMVGFLNLVTGVFGWKHQRAAQS